MFAAFLDTNVVWPSLRRDFFLSLAVERAYRPLWSDAILDELASHERRKLEGRGIAHAGARASALVSALRESFPEAIVTGWESFEGSFGLPDPDDEHVAAAAMVGGAATLVTENLKDFPADVMPPNLPVIDAAQFGFNVVACDPPAALRALQSMSRRYRRPTRTPPQIVEDLEVRYAMDAAAELIRRYLNEPLVGGWAPR